MNRWSGMTFAVSAMLVMLLVSLPAVAQAPDPFELAPGPAPVARKPVAHPHPRPIHRAEPEREPVEAAPSRAPAQTTIPAAIAVPRPAPVALAGPFDGTYTGRVISASAEAVYRRHVPQCESFGAVQMKVSGSLVAIQQVRPNGEMAGYSGTVDAAGVVTAASAVAFDGWAHRVSGSISQGRFAGVIRRRNCEFNVELTKG